MADIQQAVRDKDQAIAKSVRSASAKTGWLRWRVRTSSAPAVKDRFASALIRARKPEAAACCGPTCCSAWSRDRTNG